MQTFGMVDAVIYDDYDEEPPGLDLASKTAVGCNSSSSISVTLLSIIFSPLLLFVKSEFGLPAMCLAIA